jgi:MFS family permease
MKRGRVYPPLYRLLPGGKNLKPPTGKSEAFTALRYTEYRNLMTARMLYVMGLRMLGTIVGWWIYQLTNDPFAIGIIGISEVIPAVGLALYGGHIIDISEKRKLLLRGMSLYLLCGLVLLGLSTSFTENNLSNHTIALCIYGVIFFTGVIRAFTGPIFHTIIPLVVPKEHLQNAITWNSGVWLSASVVGHAIAGFLIALGGVTGAFAGMTILIICGIIIATRLRPRPPFETGEKKTWSSILEGISFVLKTKELVGALSLDLFAVLFGGAVAMVPVFAEDILHVGPQWFGVLNASMDLGSIFIVAILAVFPLRQKQGVKLFAAVAGFGICIIVFALSDWFWLSFAALMIAGILDGISVVVRGTIMQLKTPDNMRGRVMSVSSMFISSSNELGQFESGVAARVLGVVPSVIFGGSMTLLVVIMTWFMAPSLRKMRY